MMCLLSALISTTSLTLQLCTLLDWCKPFFPFCGFTARELHGRKVFYQDLHDGIPAALSYLMKMVFSSHELVLDPPRDCRVKLCNEKAGGVFCNPKWTLNLEV